MALTPDINILSFKNSYTIYENEVICKISDGELNMSQKPTPISSNTDTTFVIRYDQ